MRTSEQINELAAALAKAQAEMKNAAKSSVNPHFKNKYADLAEVRDAVLPYLAAHGLSVVQGMETVGDGLLVVTRLMHSSGQWIESVFPIAYDKPQSMGSSYTYARRYSLAAIGCIGPAESDDDGNAANDKPVPAPHAKPEAMPSVNGTPGASKANSRAPFDKMIGTIRNTATLRALTEWYEQNVKAIDALPADWLDELRLEYVDRQSELKKSLAA